MSEQVQYAVHLFQSALVELGEALAPYLHDGPSGKHVLCSEIDAGGPLFEMTIHAVDEAGAVLELELMVPVGMVKLVIAVQQDARFGFARRSKRVADAIVHSSGTDSAPAAKESSSELPAPSAEPAERT